MKKIKGFLVAALLGVSSLVWAASIDINTADAKTLETLHGIGPAKAKAIVEYRAQHGAFKSVDDLAAVEGIGSKLLTQLRGELTVGGSAGAAKK